MNDQVFQLCSIATLLLMAGCVAEQSTGKPPMTYEQCATASMCVAQGILSVKEVDHVPMGRLDLPDGNCINVSLRDQEIDRLRKNGPEPYTIEGEVFPASSDGTFVSLTVRGRKIGISQCGDFYVFVD